MSAVHDEYVPDEDDEEDDDEPDFIPGAEDDDEDVDGGDVLIMDGTLSLKDSYLCYIGNGFQIKSSKPVTWDSLDHIPPSASVVLEGPCDVNPGAGKPTPRSFDLTISTSQGNGKSTGEDDEMPTTFQIQASQRDTSGETLEFQGSFTPGKGARSVNLICPARLIQAAPATTAAPVAATAAAKPTNDVDDDDYGDDGVEYDELIALHEDAGMSVEELRKRYHGGGGNGSSSPSKKPKYEEDDDDDDICF